MSQPASGLFRLTNTDSSEYIDLCLPEYPYAVDILMCADLQKDDSGAFAFVDFGKAYDKRVCKFSLLLTAVSRDALATFLNDTAAIGTLGRARSLSLEFATDSGMHAFGPDKTPYGPFDVAVEVLETSSALASPFLYHRVELSLTLLDSSTPAYALPTQVAEGEFLFGSITNCRYPEEGFDPSIERGQFFSPAEGANGVFTDKTYLRQSHLATWRWLCNQSKAAAIVNYVTNTKRFASFNMQGGANYYPWGGDLDDNTLSKVSLVNNRLSLIHDSYNRWTINGIVVQYNGVAPT